MAQRIYSLLMPYDSVELFLDLPDDRRIVSIENASQGPLGDVRLVRIWIEQTVKV